MNDLTVRETTVDDAAAVQRVARASWHAAYDDVLGRETVEEKVDSWFDPKNVAADVERVERPFYVAERDGSVVGFVIGVPDDDQETTYHLYRIYVHPDFWGEGVGSRLLDALETEVLVRGGERLRLTVLQANEDAIGFYESRGFDLVGEHRGPAFDQERYIYEKEL